MMWIHHPFAVVLSVLVVIAAAVLFIVDLAIDNDDVSTAAASVGLANVVITLLYMFWPFVEKAIRSRRMMYQRAEYQPRPPPAW